MTVQEITVTVETGRSKRRIGSTIHGVATLRGRQCHVERCDEGLTVTIETPGTPTETRAVRQRIRDIAGVEAIE